MSKPAGTGIIFKILLLLICAVSIPAYSLAEDFVEVRDVRVGVTGQNTRIVIEFNRLPHYSVHRLKGPDRVYFDLKEARVSTSIKPVRINKGNKGPLKRVRIAQYTGNTVRVVLDLKALEDYSSFTLKSPPRLVINIGNEKNPFFRKRKIVVIDPGHGGRDPGAIGPRGLKEKAVTLKIARRLKKILEERYNLEVYITRNRDIYLGLDERTRIANRKKADLFVSIHSNASRKRRTRGIETYLLNWTNDAEAMKVAARENAISVEKMRKTRSELGMILTSLERESKRDESLKLAHFIQGSLGKRLSKRYRGIENLGVKQAFFYVLLGAEMPSVLVEVAFISNPKEERLLRSKKFRKRAAEAIAAGIYRYILSRPDAPKLAMNR